MKQKHLVEITCNLDEIMEELKDENYLYVAFKLGILYGIINAKIDKSSYDYDEDDE